VRRGAWCRCLLVGLAVAGCTRVTARTARRYESPAPGPVATAAVPPVEMLRAGASGIGARRRAVVETALGRLGDRAPGLDCSRFVQQTFAAAGIAVPRTVREQLQFGVGVSPDAAQPGDVVFFAFRRASADHVGILVGNGVVAHVSASAGCVQIAAIAEPGFATARVDCRRWLDAGDTRGAGFSGQRP